MTTNRQITRTVQDVEVPTFLYGTAWKEDRTESLVSEALKAGFRGFDTANQRCHYHEAGVGTALQAAFDGGQVTRQDVFLQTKYTYREGQDHRLPFDPSADVSTQVRQSFESSLEHLAVERIDSFVLHGPRTRYGLSDADREVWRAMEELHQAGRVRLLGVSNVTAEQVATLCDFARVTPAFVQNRCFARLGWDREVRHACRDLGLVYQGFSLLTANHAELSSPAIERIAESLGRSIPQIVFRFALEVGMIPLTGTTDPEHMRQDLGVYELELSDETVQTIEAISG